MLFWLNIFVISIAFYMTSYLSGSSVLSKIPTLLVILAILYTFWRVSRITTGKINNRIWGAFILAASLMAIFSLKHILMSSGGTALAMKIILYHTTFMAGLLVGFYEQPLAEKNSKYFVIALFFAPLLFFLIFAMGQPPSQAVSVFNRNAFAGYTISASALLLAFGTRKKPVPLPLYFTTVAVALILNGTLGALIAFSFAAIIYSGPKVVLNPRVLLLVAAAGVLLLVVIQTSASYTQIGVFNRLSFVYTLFSNLKNFYSGSWLELDMATAVQFAPSGDLDMSAVFRLLHWINILRVLSEGGWSAILLGGGVDWIDQNEYRFVFPLAAHNEYVRVVAEQGLIFGLILIACTWKVVLELRKTVLFVPLSAQTIYFGSENLLNNFVTTALFFFILGVTFAMNRKTRTQAPAPSAGVGLRIRPGSTSI